MKHPTCIALLVFFLTAGFTIYTWLWSGASWLHVELLGTANYVWQSPHGEDDVQRLCKVVDWQAFDPIASRARPLNDVAEVIDAIARPYLTAYLGPHPSLTPTALLTAVLAPLFLLLCLKRCLGSWAPALILGALFLSSPGFLSCIIPYIRPAKKLTLLFTCSSIYFAKRFEDDGRPLSFLALWLSMFACLFCDEQAIIHYVVVALIFFPGWNWRQRKRQIVVYLVMPLCYLAVLSWALPWLYEQLGTGPTWNTFANRQKYKMLLLIFSRHYWTEAVSQAACALLSNIGIKDHSGLMKALAVFAVLGAPLAAVMRRGELSLHAVWQNPLVRCTLGLLAASFWSSLLYRFNGPELASALGSLAAFSYYYHSGLSIFMVLWLAFLWREMSSAPANTRANVIAGPSAALSLGCLLIVANFTLFYCVNDVLQIMHTYPFSATAMNDTLAAKASEQTHESITEVFRYQSQRTNLLDQFEASGRQAFGDSWHDTFFYRTFHAAIIPKPMVDQDYLIKLTKAYFPRSTWQVEIRLD